MAPHERAGGEGEVEPEVDVNAIVVAQVETNMKGKTGKERGIVSVRARTYVSPSNQGRTKC